MQKYFARHALGIMLTLVLLVFAEHSLVGQISGRATVQGVVSDSTGAVIPNATVTMTKANTNAVFKQTTTKAGFFSLAALDPGEYTIIVEHVGFEKLVQEHITVDALQVRNVNLSLHPGAATETVTVTAVPDLNNANGTIGMTMDNHTYQSLPVQISGSPRDPTAFVTLQPGVVGDGHSGQFNGGQSYHDETYIEGIALTDASQGGNNAMVNRAASLDAVDQFQVETSGGSAAYQGQGTQNYVIKSGTNQFHGSAFEYFRNTVLNTWGFFSKAQINAATGQPTKPPEHQNEFGGTFQGPILKNKMFFAFSYDDMRYSKLSNPSYVTIPTAKMRQGDFSEYLAQNGGPGYLIYDPASMVCATSSSCTKTAFAGNIIPQSQLSPQAKYLESFLPAPTNSSLTNNYLAGFKTGYLYKKISIKTDYELTPRQRLTGLYMMGNRNANPECCDGAGLPQPYTSTVGNSQQFKFGLAEHVFTISPHLVNQFKYGYSREGGVSVNAGEGDPQWAATKAGITNIPAGQASDAFPRVGFSGVDGVTGWDTANRAGSSRASTYVLSDTMQLTKGSHSLSFGGQYQWLQSNATTVTTGTYLTLSYSPNETANFKANSTTINSATGLGYASFMLGATDSAGITDFRPVVTTGGRYKTFSPFIEDYWKITPALTLNLGLRWDLYLPYHEVQNRISFLNPNIANPIAIGAMGALQFAGDGVYGCHCSTPISTWYKNVGPHLGFAYSINAKTVIRGAYNIAYAHSGGTGGRGGNSTGPGQLGFTGSVFPSSTVSGQPAFYLQKGVPSYTLPPDIEPGYGTGYTTTPGFSTPSAMTVADPYLGGRSPYYNNYNFGFEREIYKKAVLSANYSGSTGHFLGTSEGRGRYTNQLDPQYYVLGSLLSSPSSAANIAKAQTILPSFKLPFSNFDTTQQIGQALRPFAQYNGVSDAYGNIGHSSYNALLISLTQKPLAGFNYVINYTWSKLMDDAGTGRTAYSHDQEYALSTTDVPNILNVYAVYSEPFGKGRHAFLNVIEKDWTVSSIFRYSAGTPLVITGSSCTTYMAGTCMPYLDHTFSGSARINGGYGDGVTAANASTVRFIDPKIFINTNLLSASPYAYTFGDAPRTYAYRLRGPGSNNIDVSLRRAFPIYERLRFTFQADVFNLTNTVRFNNPNLGYSGYNATTGVANGSFGTVTSQGNSSRDWQMVARFDF